MDDIGKLMAIEEIKITKARYFRGVDEKNEALLREVFADDVELDYREGATDPVTGFNAAPETTNIVQRGGDHCAKMVAESLVGVVSVHHGSIGEITINDENSASAIWPMVDRLRFSSNSPIAEMIGYGHYYETYVRERGKWRIRTLKLTRLRIDVIASS